MNFRRFLEFVRLARNRLSSPRAYLDFQQFQGDLLIEYLGSHQVDVADLSVLDLGCGLGGYSLALQRHAARVVSLDLAAPEDRSLKRMVRANALELPFGSQAFDLLICASLIEHVQSPQQLIGEIERVLKPGGIAYLSYPPFYSPNGGHQFSPFHLLGERVAIRMFKARGSFQGKQWLEEHFDSSPGSYAEAWGTWGLYPLTIRKVSMLLKEFRFKQLNRSTRWLPVDFSGIPALGELLTWHVQFLLQKEITILATPRPNPLSGENNSIPNGRLENT